MSVDLLAPIGTALFFLGLLLEHGLLRRGGSGYFKWGLTCYAADLYPERPFEGDPDAEVDPEVEQAETKAWAQQVLAPLEHALTVPGAVRTDRDPHQRWRIRALGGRSFALVARGLNPLALRARLELGEDGGVAIAAFVPYSLLLVIAPGALALTLSGWAAGAVAAAVVVAVVVYLRALDELFYKRIERFVT